MPSWANHSLWCRRPDSNGITRWIKIFPHIYWRLLWIYYGGIYEGKKWTLHELQELLCENKERNGPWNQRSVPTTVVSSEAMNFKLTWIKMVSTMNQVFQTHQNKKVWPKGEIVLLLYRRKQCFIHQASQTALGRRQWNVQFILKTAFSRPHLSKN